jgi:hypothetical protein
LACVYGVWKLILYKLMTTPRIQKVSWSPEARACPKIVLQDAVALLPEVDRISDMGTTPFSGGDPQRRSCSSYQSRSTRTCGAQAPRCRQKLQSMWSQPAVQRQILIMFINPKLSPNMITNPGAKSLRIKFKIKLTLNQFK